MQRQGGQKEEEEEQKGSSSIKNEEVPSTTAAFSVFYGVNDTRNFTERVSIDQHQNIDHVYIMVSIVPRLFMAAAHLIHSF